MNPAMFYSRMSCLDETVKLFGSTIIDYLRPLTNKLFNSCYLQNIILFCQISLKLCLLVTDFASFTPSIFSLSFHHLLPYFWYLFPLFFHFFLIISQFFSVFSISFHYSTSLSSLFSISFHNHSSRGRRDRVVVWFKTTYEIGVYHH